MTRWRAIAFDIAVGLVLGEIMFLALKWGLS